MCRNGEGGWGGGRGEGTHYINITVMLSTCVYFILTNRFKKTRNTNLQSEKKTRHQDEFRAQQHFCYHGPPYLTVGMLSVHPLSCRYW